MSTILDQIKQMSDFKVLVQELVLGIVDRLYVTTNGMVAEVPREAIFRAYTPQGEYILFGDLCSIGEHEIELMLTNDETGAVTLMTCHGQVIMIEPSSDLFVSHKPLTFQEI